MLSQLTQFSRPITTLPQDVINRIAAGEVLVRPMNAVKELIENSLDAGATEITVTCKNGGLDLIKVKDNGCGISSADYERVCERHATSKLRTVADLQNVSTFGFRGEALASISVMSKVQIVSRTKESAHAWNVAYKNCKPLSTPKVSAGVIGTQVVAEKLFGEYPQRRAAFNNPQDEAVGIAKVLIKYAINFPNVKFSFVRDDGSFSSAGKGDQHAVIRSLMPSNLTKDLIDFEVKSEKYKFSAKICMASPLSSFTSKAIKAQKDKQKSFQLFINNRLITCTKLKQVIDTTFSTNDAYCPFMIVSMQIEPSRIDCNIHPTKELVCFLDETQIGDIIQTKLFEIMANFRQNGIVEVNTPGHSSNYKSSSKSKSPEISPIHTPRKSENSSQTVKKRKLDVSDDKVDLQRIQIPKMSTGKQSYVPSMAMAFQLILSAPNQMVRVDSRNRSMEEFVSRNQSLLNNSGLSLPPGETSFYEEILDETTVDPAILSFDEFEEHDENVVDLTLDEIEDHGKHALKALDEFRAQNSDYLTGLVRNFVFVGFIDLYHAVFQSGNSIYMVELMPVLEEMFYQRCLESIGKLKGRRIVLNVEKDGYDGYALVSLVDTFLAAHSNAHLPNLSRFADRTEAIDELVMKVGLPENIKRLWFEFGIKIVMDKDVGPIVSTVLTQVDGYIPLINEQIARFGYDLICVNWEMPEVATKEIARALARFNTPYQLSKCSEPDTKYQCEMIKCRFLNLMKTEFNVPEKLKPNFTKLLSTFDAFKIFGRC